MSNFEMMLPSIADLRGRTFDNNKDIIFESDMSTESESLNVIALISGGKDSLFSILHCLEHGHKIVALGNLYPAPLPSGSHPADTDSFMYQTIGHTIVPLYAECLDIPLYRTVIRGGAADTAENYSLFNVKSQDQAHLDAPDETESLAILLTEIKAAHPEANAVSTGAILSTYQRTRVESVATRLGLISLAYLWQYPILEPHTPTSLLEDMASVEQDSRIIKVASGGLEANDLWKNVANPETVKELFKVMGRFDKDMLLSGSILGEGGEYETVAIDGPNSLWKRRIVVDDLEKDIGSGDGVLHGESGSRSLIISKARTVQKNPDEDALMAQLRVPKTMDFESLAMINIFIADAPGPQRVELLSAQELDILDADETKRHQHTLDGFRANVFLAHDKLYMSNLLGTMSGISDLLNLLTQLLTQRSLGPENIIHSTLLIRDMKTFNALNTVYGTLFRRPLPPSRVTVSCGCSLPEGFDILASFVINRKPITTDHPRKGLHVQSRSYWAPANIGPYSQAILFPISSEWLTAPSGADATQMNHGTMPALVYIAGQIPLIPRSMTVPIGNSPDSEECEFEYQAALALQHLWRIGRAVKVTGWTGALAYIARIPSTGQESSEDEMARRASMCCWLWQAAHIPREDSAEDGDEDEDMSPAFDIGDAALRREWDPVSAQPEQATAKAKHRVDCRPKLPDWTRVHYQFEGVCSPPCFVVEVESLPRGVEVEWSSVGISGHVDVTLGGRRVAVKGTRTYVKWHAVPLDGSWGEVMEAVKGELSRAFCEVYTSGRLPMPDAARDVFGGCMIVPCRRIWWREGVEVAAAVKVWVEGWQDLNDGVAL